MITSLKQNWEYKVYLKALQVASEKLWKNIIGIIKTHSCFLTSTLSEQKIIAIISLLLVFQFSLYDFNIGEYTRITLHH